MADMSFDSMIEEYLVYCHARQLRQKTMNSYEQALRLFQRWCFDELGITTVDAVSESVMRHYIIGIQERGKLSGNLILTNSLAFFYTFGLTSASTPRKM